MNAPTVGEAAWQVRSSSFSRVPLTVAFDGDSRGSRLQGQAGVSLRCETMILRETCIWSVACTLLQRIWLIAKPMQCGGTEDAGCFIRRGDVEAVG